MEPDSLHIAISVTQGAKMIALAQFTFTVFFTAIAATILFLNYIIKSEYLLWNMKIN